MYTAKVGIALNCFQLPEAPSRNSSSDRSLGCQTSWDLVFRALGALRAVFPLGNRQDKRAGGSTAATAHISRVPTRSIDRHASGSRRGDHSSSNRGLQLRTACDQSAQIGSVDDHNGGRNKLSAIHMENKALLHFSQRNRTGGKGSNDRDWTSASTQRIDGVAGLKEQRGEHEHAERPQKGTDSFHRGSYHRPAYIKDSQPVAPLRRSNLPMERCGGCQFSLSHGQPGSYARPESLQSDKMRSR